jgi:7-cyano-7-deazaguanine reductase
MTELPLGKTTTIPERYAPDCLYPIARTDGRETIGLTGALPFRGFDIWNAWELTWLGPGGLPHVAIAEIRVPVESPNIVESKSMKLYLGSFAMSEFETASAVRDAIAADIGACVGAAVDVEIDAVTVSAGRRSHRLPGKNLDRQQIECDSWDVDPAILSADNDSYVSETLNTDLLRSLCPVTGQPDSGSVLITYEGPRIDRAALLRYIVSYRQHQAFHEACVERMYVDVLQRCKPVGLTVYARYQRRGGIDINPFRSNFESIPQNLRLWRQ